ncbi:sensor histidine kinase [Aureivirga sp. CE67]|uniref:sensor histidine kinase n=1 Tax=Aureivirga sp. CE67 TaxID=1788983 RepID=UPI0018CAD09B|nr:histidine kinase [Aureivirga sp. CE67]
MQSFLTKYQKGIFLFCFTFFLVFTTSVSFAYSLEITGNVAFILTLAFPLSYLLFFIISKKKKFAIWSKKEIVILIATLILLFSIGTFEASSKLPAFFYVFLFLLIYSILFGGLIFRNFYLEKKGKKTLSKKWFLRILIWTLVLAFWKILLLIDNYGDSDALIIVSFIYFPLVIYLILNWIFKQTKNIINLKKEQQKMELLHLKSQVNPHFFFNTLNNLYGLVGTDKEKAQKLILKLSDMMRYSIYEGEKEYVALEEEIQFLQNYIELHQMRYRKEITIKFEENINSDQKITPLLFIILLENAFKHGVENLRENAFIEIKITSEDNKVQFSIVNNFDPDEIPEKAGIGLKNLKRRLELMYPNRHQLIFSKKENIYETYLTLEL